MNVEQIYIRRAHGADLPQLTRLVEQYRAVFGMTPDASGVSKFLVTRLDNNDALIRVAEAANEQLVGFCLVLTIPGTVRLQKHFMLQDIFVHPDWRRRGIARLMVSDVQEQATESGAIGIMLEAPTHLKAAQELYPRMGFGRYQGAKFYWWSVKQ